MFTFIVLVVIAVLWFIAHKDYMSSGQWKYRRLRSAYAWAFVGAAIGSFFGLAGFGWAIIGTIPGAFIGYLAASNAMKKDYDK